MRVIAWGLLILVVAVLAYIRLAPSDPQRWNVDPLSAEKPDGNGWLVRPEGGNTAGKVYDCAPETLLETLDQIALATQRTRRLTGTVAEGQITYITRSRLFGFPDYSTISTLEVEGGATPAIFARQRFGKKDMGVNRGRVEAWQGALNAEPECLRKS